MTRRLDDTDDATSVKTPDVVRYGDDDVSTADVARRADDKVGTPDVVRHGDDGVSTPDVARRADDKVRASDVVRRGDDEVRASDDEVRASDQVDHDAVIDMPARMTMMNRLPARAATESGERERRDSSPRMTMRREPDKERA